MSPKYIQHVAAVLLLYLFSTEKSFPYFLSLHLFFFASVTWIIQFSLLLPLPFLPPFLPLISSDTLLFLFPLPHPFLLLLLVLPSFLLISLSFLSPPFLFISLLLSSSYTFPYSSLTSLSLHYHFISFPFLSFPQALQTLALFQGKSSRSGREGFSSVLADSIFPRYLSALFRSCAFPCTSSPLLIFVYAYLLLSAHTLNQAYNRALIHSLTRWVAYQFIWLTQCHTIP